MLSRANSLIVNNNIRSVLLEIKNDRCKIIFREKIFKLTLKCSWERERNISILTILHQSFLISNMTLLILLLQSLEVV